MDVRTAKKLALGLHGMNTPDSAITQLFRGFDHRQSGANFQRDTYNHGYVFYTRPMMNLSYDNISGDPLLSLLIDENTRSPFRYIRALLDPQGRYDSALLASDQAFIPILTNTCVSHSGWPDIGIDSYVAPDGLRRESWAIGDSVAEFNSTIDLTASFENSYGNILSYMFHIWIKYIGAVKLGEMEPYPQAWMLDYADYMSRCWRVVLDKQKKYVVAIATSVASYPENVPIGASFNFNKESVFPQDTDQVSIQWKSNAIEYNYGHLYEEFNENVCFYNAGMLDGAREQLYIKIGEPHPQDPQGFNRNANDINLVNYENLYPRINPETYEFEWWMKRQDYNRMKTFYG